MGIFLSPVGLEFCELTLSSQQRYIAHLRFLQAPRAKHFRQVLTCPWLEDPTNAGIERSPPRHDSRQDAPVPGSSPPTPTASPFPNFALDLEFNSDPDPDSDGERNPEPPSPVQQEEKDESETQSPTLLRKRKFARISDHSNPRPDSPGPAPTTPSDRAAGEDRGCEDAPVSGFTVPPAPTIPVVEAHSLTLGWEMIGMRLEDPHYVFSTFQAVTMPLEPKGPIIELSVKTQGINFTPGQVRIAKLRVNESMVRHFFSKYIPSSPRVPEQIKFKLGDDPKFFIFTVFPELTRTLARFYYNYSNSDALAVQLLKDFPNPGISLSRLPSFSQLNKTASQSPLVRKPPVTIVIDDG